MMQLFTNTNTNKASGPAVYLLETSCYFSLHFAEPPRKPMYDKLIPQTGTLTGKMNRKTMYDKLIPQTRTLTGKMDRERITNKDELRLQRTVEFQTYELLNRQYSVTTIK